MASLPRYEELDREIRAGRTAQVKERLEGLKRTAIPPAEMARYAELARRAGAPALALRWLGPHVRPQARAPRASTAAERLEYAAALVRLGALREAKQLLATVDEREVPRAAFEIAAIHIAEWRYREAIPPLERFVEAPSTGEYERFVGLVNLAASYVFEENYERSTPLLRTLLHETSVRRYELLLGNVLQLSAMSALTRGKLDEAERFLDHSARRLEAARPLEQFFLRKWRAVVALSRRPGDEGVRRTLRAVGLEAEEIGHWETRRDVDRYLALLTGDEALLRHLWFGTPFEGYRARLVKEWGRPLSLGDSYERGRGHVLDVTSGAVGRKSIRNLPREHRLLATLASDFYRPFRVAALFEALFPDERFLPTTSANRVHQAVRELRGWLEAHAPGITVEAHGSDYRLVVGAGWAVCVPAAAPSFETPDARALRDLKQRFADRPFTTREAAAALAVSGRTALRWLADAVAEGKLERQGKRAAASYRFRTEG